MPIENGVALSNVTLTIDSESETFQGRRFEGGQRIMIPRPYTFKIIGALLKGKSCRLELEGDYSTTLIPSNFCDAWHSKPPLVPYPHFF